MYIVRTFNPCFKNVSNTIISVQNLKDLKNKVTFANIVFMSSGQYSSMTTLLSHTVAHSTKPSFMPKTNNQPPKKFLSLALS